MLLSNYFLKDLKDYYVIPSDDNLFSNPFKPYYTVKLVWKQWYRLPTKFKFYHNWVGDIYFASPEYIELKNQLDNYLSNTTD